MATKAKTVTALPYSGVKAHVVVWAALANGDDGDPIELVGQGDRSIQFAGTFDTSTIVWEGSNDGSTWATLTDPQGNAISKTAAAIEAISEMTRYMRPKCTAGGGSTAIVPTLFVKG